MFSRPEMNVIMCCNSNREAVMAATHYYTRAWVNVKTQKKNVISSLLYTYNRFNCLHVLDFSKKGKFPLKEPSFILLREMTYLPRNV